MKRHDILISWLGYDMNPICLDTVLHQSFPMHANTFTYQHTFTKMSLVVTQLALNLIG